MFNKLNPLISTGNILIVLYLTLIWLSASTFFQFKTIGVLEDSFPGDASQWRIEGNASDTIITPNDVAIYPASDKRVRLGRTYMLESRGAVKRYVLVQASIVSEKIHRANSGNATNKGTQESLFYAWFADKNRKSIRINTMYDLAPKNRRIYSQSVIPVPENAVSMNIELLQRQFKTKHTLVQLQIEQIEKTFLYKVSLVLLIVLPLLFILYFLRRLVSQSSILAMTMVAVIASVLTGGVLISGDVLKAVIRNIARLVPGSQSLTQYFDIISLQDALHFIGFLVLTLAVLTLCKINRYNSGNGIVKVILFALFTEIIQRHSVERSSSFMDIAIDLAGVATGVCAWTFLNRAVSRRETEE